MRKIASSGRTSMPEVDGDAELTEIASSTHTVNYLLPEWDWLRIQEFAVANDLSSVSEGLRLALTTFLDNCDIRDRLDEEATIAVKVERDRRRRLSKYGQKAD